MIGLKRILLGFQTSVYPFPAIVIPHRPHLACENTERILHRRMPGFHAEISGAGAVDRSRIAEGRQKIGEIRII